MYTTDVCIPTTQNKKNKNSILLFNDKINTFIYIDVEKYFKLDFLFIILYQKVIWNRTYLQKNLK